ncbi:MAG: Uncharacterised protein [Cellulomonadaceae bacterium TMED98]|nr:MAG: Uncharacterised protein [Cellulomonadaceae bacterium TMED98]
MFPDIAQERNRVQIFGPVEVIDQRDAAWPCLVKKPGDLGPEALDPRGNSLWVIERALRSGLRVSDQAR